VGPEDDPISARREHGAWLVRLSHDLDLSQLDALRSRFEEVLAEDLPVVVDMRGVHFVDSTILGLLLLSARKASGGFALVVDEGGSVARLLELANVSAHVATFASPEDALSALTERRGEGGAGLA
jgi:anti-anti-sigma factor